MLKRAFSKVVDEATVASSARFSVELSTAASSAKGASRMDRALSPACRSNALFTCVHSQTDHKM
jgi:hypothetical protein